MKKKVVKRILATVLTGILAIAMLAGCGDKKGSETGKDDAEGKSAEFTWWINKTDGDGQFYDTYEQSPVAQFINQQYWDTENGGIGTEENGTKLSLSYLVPITGSEKDNFSTMISTGEYPDIIDMAYSTDSPQALIDSEILMDITEYVEEYMPNYVAYLEANPELKPFVQVQDDEGNLHYYALYSIVDGVEDPWQGYCYRRDWIVKYAEPTEYVWDWESDYVKENGHPAVTPLEKAMEENNLEGWKKNEVTEFEAKPGDQVDDTYTDNVIFPSGTADPLTISDWEWMLAAFDKAIEARGWGEDSNSYGISVPYFGFSSTGEIVSSFGGGTGNFYIKDGTVTFDGASENFKTYIECMQKWHEKGWLDSQLHTRASDMFFRINTAGVTQGKVGMWCGSTSTLGSAIRTSCQSAEDQADAFVMGTALPLNDMYGTDDQKYVEPDALYQASRRGMPVGITEKAEGKDLKALFTFLDWTYSEEGAKTFRIGLNEEQYKSVKLDPDIFADNNLTTAYTESTDEEGKKVFTPTVDTSTTLFNALMGQRMDVGLKPTMSGEMGVLEKPAAAVVKNAFVQWTKYSNSGNVVDYTGLLTTDESDVYGKVSTAALDYQAQVIPGVISKTTSWEEYVKGLEQFDTKKAAGLLQKYVDMAKSAE